MGIKSQFSVVLFYWNVIPGNRQLVASILTALETDFRSRDQKSVLGCIVLLECKSGESSVCSFNSNSIGNLFLNCGSEVCFQLYCNFGV